MPTYVKCCICQGPTSTQTTLEETCIGVPPILIKDVLINCFESLENFRKVVNNAITNNYLCNFCETSLGIFYDAVLKVSSKRTEFLSRVVEKSVNPIENFVIFENQNRDLSSSHETINHAKNYELEPFVPQDFIDIDSCDEYLTLNTSEEDFVKVYQPEEDFEDDWSSNSSNDFLANDTKRKPLITIERIPKTKLRYCWRCDKNFPSDDDFEVHLKQVHTKSKKPSCSSRNIHKGYAFEDQSVHALIDQNFTFLRCEYCSEEFDSSLLLQLHKKTHKERTWSRTISSHRSLQRRRTEKRSKSPDVRLFICPVCDFEFRSAWNLKRHQKMHCLGDISRNSGKTSI